MVADTIFLDLFGSVKEELWHLQADPSCQKDGFPPQEEHQKCVTSYGSRVGKPSKIS